MRTTFLTFRLTGALGCVCASLAFPVTRAVADSTPAAAATPDADAFPTFESYVKISGQAPWITGDDAAFATRTGTPNTGSGGIEDLFYSKDLSDSSTLTVNGHALGGTDDYLADFKLDTTNVGTVDVGYKSFRTFYDGIGGFFPLADDFLRMSPELLHVDRGAFWAEARLAKPDCPVFTISFRDETRAGMKDSSEWAPEISPLAVVTAGALVGTAAPTNTPELVPNVMTIAEHHDMVDASMVAKLGSTEETLKGTIDTVNDDDGRDYVKYPNSAVIADPTVVVQDDIETRRSTSFQALNQTETKLSDKIDLDTGLTYLHLSSANGGFWITPTYSSTANAIYAADTAADIYGGSKFDDYVGNVSLKYTPTPNWLADLAFRDEYNVTGSSGGYTATTLATGATTTAPSNLTVSQDVTYSHYLDHIATPEFNLQFLGLKDFCLYLTADDRVDHGSQHWVNPYALITTAGVTGAVTVTSPAPAADIFFQDADENNKDLKVGANWNPSRFLTVRAEVYRKDHQNQFIGDNDPSLAATASYGGYYVTGYTFTGMKFTVMLRINDQLSFSTRYQPQIGMMSVTGATVNGGSGNEITSGKASGQMISESANYTPFKQMYLQGNINIVYNYIQTAYPVVVVTTTPPLVPVPFQNSNDNYISSDALCGFVLDKTTDAQLQVVWSQANDYNPQIALGGQPYGAGFLEESVTAGLKHKFNDRLMGEGKAGYLRRTDDTTGGFTNYKGPLLYASLTYSL